MFDGVSTKESDPHRGCFMTTGGAASNVVAAGALLTRASGTKFGQRLDYSNDRLGKNDIAILRFLVAIELIESDLWRQYEELGGATDGAQNNYQLELQFLDIDSSKYISRNATDEIEHEKFLNAYLESEDVEPLGFDEFRILQGSTAGAVSIGRLTNLMHLNPDMVLHGTEKSRNSWTNPPQGVHFVDSSTIPRNEADLNDPAQIQAIANMAAFHFGFIELGISSLYASISRKVRRAKILEVTLGIGAQEIAHFLQWTNLVPFAVQNSPFGFNRSQKQIKEQSLTLSGFNTAPDGPRNQTDSLICSEFVRKNISLFSIFRSSNHCFDGAVETINTFTRNGLFFGQSEEFLPTLMALAREADDAMRC
jgi:hypothetical protein